MQITSLRQYQAESRKTAIYPDMGSNLWYPSLGLIEELDELANAEARQIPFEIGDVAWYISQIYSELDLDLETIDRSLFMKPEDDWYSVWHGLWGHSYISDGFIAKTAKKWHRDGETIERRQDFVSICQYFWWLNVDNSRNFNTEYPDVWAILSANIGKLQDRQSRNVIKGDGDKR
jgi:hypothetical protein